MLKIVRLNRLTPGLLILSALFFYDIFWVFFSSHIFGGQSVMIVVATSIDVPAKLVFPSWNVFTSWSLIGLGDLFIPGFYISYVSRFGESVNSKLYYASHLCAYFLSILLCIFVISFGYGGQPALLYIVPSLFLTTFIIGYRRGELQKLFNGVSPRSNDENSQESNPSDNSIGNDINLQDINRRP